MNTASEETPALKISGEFTIFTAQALKVQLLALIDEAGEGCDVDVDLSDVTEIDSAGLQLMLMAKREATTESKNVRFIRHSDSVLELIDLCALSSQFGDPLLIHSQARARHES